MDSISDLTAAFSDANTILLIAAIAVFFLLISWAIKIFRFTLGPLLGIVAIVLLLKFVFGISPNQLWYEVKEIPQLLSDLIREGLKAIS